MLMIITALQIAQDPLAARSFEVSSTDRVVVHGQVDRPDLVASGVVIMVAGTGPFDRDEVFGRPGGEPAPVFVDLADRLTARGVTSVRYDKRGVRYGQTGDARIDREEIVSATTDAMRDDLAAVYDWTRAPQGLGAQCVALFGHSEGVVHIGRLAASGAPPPVVTIGIGAVLTSPARNFRWNLTERDSWSLRAMDADGDGVTTNDEVRAGLALTPAAVNEVLEPYLAPDGSWTAADIDDLDARWAILYPAFRDQTLAAADDAPWPTPEIPAGSMQWWKSWYLDHTPVAENLAHWSSPVIVHLGTRDSQTHAPLQREAGEKALGSRLTFSLHSDVGHTLGASPTYGPMEEALADQVAGELATALRSCAQGG